MSECTLSIVGILHRSASHPSSWMHTEIGQVPSSFAMGANWLSAIALSAMILSGKSSGGLQCVLLSALFDEAFFPLQAVSDGFGIERGIIGQTHEIGLNIFEVIIQCVN